MADSNFLNTMTVKDIFAIPARGLVAAGQVTDGSFSVGDTVEILRQDGSTRTAEIGGIEIFMKALQTVKTGDRADILLKGMSKSDVGAGDIIRR